MNIQNIYTFYAHFDPKVSKMRSTHSLKMYKYF